MAKIWEWLKKWWKWIVFPVGILGVVLSWFFWWHIPEDDQFSTPDAAADDAVNAAIKAARQRRIEIEAIELKHALKLVAMSSEQKKEYKVVREKTPEEVAAWIDNI